MLDPRIESVSTVKELFEVKASISDGKRYLVYTPTMEEYSYGDLNKWANRIAHALVELGVRKGDRIASFLRNSLLYIASMHGIYKIGAIEVPVNWFYGG